MTVDGIAIFVACSGVSFGSISIVGFDSPYVTRKKPDPCSLFSVVLRKQAGGCAQTFRMEQRREALAERDRLFAVEQRHHLAVAPHVRRAAVQRVAGPRPRALEIVPREERHAAGAEEVAPARIERRRSARN